jgi:hypothetical protein
MENSPNSIVLDSLGFDSADATAAKDGFEACEEYPALLSFEEEEEEEKEEEESSPPSVSPDIALISSLEDANGVPEVKYAFLRCLRKLVQTPGLVSWSSDDEDGRDIFSFSSIKVNIWITALRSLVNSGLLIDL